MLKLKILIPKISKQRSDSFWYSGTIATIGTYELIASGDIRITFLDDGSSGKNGWAVHDAYNRGYKDKDLIESAGKIGWQNNNWFEVVCTHGECVLGDVAYDYDEAIQLLKQYFKENIFGCAKLGFHRRKKNVGALQCKGK